MERQGVEIQINLKGVIDLAFDHFHCFSTDPDFGVVKGSKPILFFGSLEDYQKSRCKIITVGLNPSVKEFEEKRFDFTDNPKDYCGYIGALSRYFKYRPYNWFNRYDKFLSHFNASFYCNKEKNIALHTDLITPLATNPKWSDLKKELPKDKEEKLFESGFNIWAKLINVLSPDLIICSIGKEYLRAFDKCALKSIGKEFLYGKKTHHISIIQGYRFPIFHLQAQVKPLMMKDEQFPELAEIIKQNYRKNVGNPLI